jgi:BirA family biotin operon repressor/biotin-[acetyl-CoA-carboxylase] ligase
MTLAGVKLAGDELTDAVLSRYLGNLTEYLDRFAAADGDARASGIHRIVSEWCRTLGRPVRVSLPDETDLFGVAIGIDDTGCVLVRREGDENVVAVAAGDVTHLRHQ